MKQITRRQILSSTAVALVSSPLLAPTVPLARASSESPLDPEDAQAKALSYVHDSPKSESNCANCQLYTGAEGSEWGHCAIFPGKQVAASGWCTAWAQKTA